MKFRVAVAAMLAGFAMATGTIGAVEVFLPHDGRVLNGNLEQADGKSLTDGVILMTHAGLAHRGMEIMTRLQALLEERGYNTLAINLSLGLDNRHGMYDCRTTHRHRFTDATQEIGAWVAWLESQGIGEVTLLGHSRGGAQTAMYAAGSDTMPVRQIILVAPDTRETNDAAAYVKRYAKSLAPIVDRAQRLIDAGHGDEVLEHVDFLYCPDTSVTAETFISYYGTDPRLDAVNSIRALTKPTLLLLAGEDEILVNNSKYLSLPENGSLQVQTIDGAGHFFLDLYADDAADAIDAFLKGNAKGSQ